MKKPEYNRDRRLNGYSTTEIQLQVVPLLQTTTLFIVMVINYKAHIYKHIITIQLYKGVFFSF